MATREWVQPTINLDSKRQLTPQELSQVNQLKKLAGTEKLTIKNILA